MKNVTAALCPKSGSPQASLMNSQISTQNGTKRTADFYVETTGHTCDHSIDTCAIMSTEPWAGDQKRFESGMKGVGDFLEPGGQCWLLREEAALLMGGRSEMQRSWRVTWGPVTEQREPCAGRALCGRSGPNTTAAIWLEEAGRGHLT